MAIYELIGASHDGHFTYNPDVFKGFFFENSLVQDLVTVSVDGIEPPKLYHLSIWQQHKWNNKWGPASARNYSDQWTECCRCCDAATASFCRLPRSRRDLECRHALLCCSQR
ncbi:hypothetical protein QBC40DRAFT_271612 [Triangularia verruculosa]|uniref:Uncharacterized protein n=1 Tax=Triangularia verruculosa TaxID=2587418 RepID=A0AAN6XQD3_9PEZI|nr:hypothetical protein QBC40DRAFT_271612 [Triangularia verruculosa]